MPALTNPPLTDLPIKLNSATAGNLFLIVAPSGAGKSTLVNALLKQDNTLKLSISYTTRLPRPVEQQGQDYHFISVADFLSRKEKDEFLECAEVHGNYYGTSKLWILKQIQSGNDVILEIDWQGARQVKTLFTKAVEIFILPPSLKTLEERLKARGQDEPHIITRRLLAAGGEIAHATEADYVIVNQDRQQALNNLSAIVSATRLRLHSQYAKHLHLFTDLGVVMPEFNQ